MNTQIQMRYTQAEDAIFLRQWIEQKEVLKWFPMETPTEIEDALRCWIGYCRYLCSLTASIDGSVCGIGTLFLMPYQKVSHHALFKVVVNPSLQKRGVGSDLIKNLKHLAKNYFHLEKIGIEIFEGNPIQSILDKQGFCEVFRQEGYVKDNEKLLSKIYMECRL